ncbi:hypothetical protein ACVWYH_010020 [Bradyrhizobium sp. GM24.11]
MDSSAHDPGDVTFDFRARLGGSTCSTIRDRFDMTTPTLDDSWSQRQS